MSERDYQEPAFTWEQEKELLTRESESLRDFYSLTGPSRKDFLVQMAEAEAERIRLVGEARADAIRKMREAEAQGYRAIAEALKMVDDEDKDAVVRLVALSAVRGVSESLGSGRATKIFLPSDLGGVFSVLDVLRDALSSKDSRPTGSNTADGQKHNEPLQSTDSVDN